MCKKSQLCDPLHGLFDSNFLGYLHYIYLTVCLLIKYNLRESLEKTYISSVSLESFYYLRTTTTTRVNARTGIRFLCPLSE